jgi:hypothetical protein
VIHIRHLTPSLATARIAGNLGFDTYVVSDAAATFDKVDLIGNLRTAEEIRTLSLANLRGNTPR